jgi:hypothetical protein
MKLQTLALALAVAAGGITAGQAFAQDRDITVTREAPNGALVTKHIERREDGPVVHRVVRIHRPDGSTVVRRSTRFAGEPGYGYGYHRMHGYRHMHGRTLVIHRRWDPEHHVMVRTVHERPGYVVNRHVTVIHNAG